MGTLVLGAGARHAERAARAQPRVYADANMPAGVVAFMRRALRWDVLFVLEHDDLRRARTSSTIGWRGSCGRTLVTLDRDYLDDRRFPPDEGAGVIVFSAPDERWLRKLLRHVDRRFFRPKAPAPLPLEGRKLQWHIGDARDRRRRGGDAP